MSILLYIVIAIVAVILVIFALFYLVKGIFILIFWFLKLLPTIIKTTFYWTIAVLFCFVLNLFDKIPPLPNIAYPLLYLIIICLIFVRMFIKHGSLFSKSGRGYKSYVLNTKSKVIHEKYSDSAETISDAHRKELSYFEALELISNNENFRFKEDI